VARFTTTSLAVDSIGPVDISLHGGECLGLGGPSGAGKTRLLRAMADLDAHDGQCRLDGQAAAAIAAPVWRSRVMYLAAEPAWWADTPGEHLPAQHALVADWLDALRLDAGLLDQPIGQTSSGQRQRLALLRMLCLEPIVLLLDEPTANLDADNSRAVEQLIRDYCNERGACAVWVSHDIAQLARVADYRLALSATGQVNPWS